MASSVQPRVKAAHVNMMTDTIIKNLPADGLRVIVRSILAAHPEITGSFEAETQKYIEETALPAVSRAGSRADMQWLESTRSTIRCMVGCGLCYQALPLAGELARNALGLSLEGSEDEKSWTSNSLPSMDGDIVQAATAVQKTLMTPSGVRNPTEDELQLIRDLHNVLIDGQQAATQASIEYPYSRALAATSSLLGLPIGENRDQTVELGEIGEAPLSPLETFALSGRKLPRVFSGLWQLSSPAWGSAPTSKILSQFVTHVRSGFTVFDMADHYGDAELIFGRFRSAYPHKESLFAATKYCVFHPLTVTREAVQANVTERCQRLQTQRIDLLQFHWQLYHDPQYLDALRYLAEDDRVGSLGLCNFDTEHMEKVIQTGVTICSNQVQFSLIDSRPTIRMGELCQKHDIKLLTYGTLCGGFLAEKWLGVTEPDLYDESITPSQRKYHGMIRSWGDWISFQELLKTLKAIGTKHKVSISNVATRWVLDFPYVGAVIVGARMGISEHTEENMASLGWSLDDEDREAVERLLQKSRRHEMFEAMGDCGGEYR
ncbi:NADP-dependent oxidoreductase domain-containing protein [Apiospora arundinis]|uniref:NADP-dependent oxidoreductase domain-containing protein n=1 Tax=Apiospora arundinis TaxID=335852 RepID=A0ABR2I3Y8_9PEZI